MDHSLRNSALEKCIILTEPLLNFLNEKKSAFSNQVVVANIYLGRTDWYISLRQEGDGVVNVATSQLKGWIQPGWPGLFCVDFDTCSSLAYLFCPGPAHCKIVQVC